MSKNKKIWTLDEVLNKVGWFEGFHSRPYRCPAGVLTIGYGHTDGVKPKDRVTIDQAMDLLHGDFLYCQRQLQQSFHIKDVMNTNQIYALTDFVFNLGIGALCRSSAAPYLRKYASVHPQTRTLYDICIAQVIRQYNKFRKDGKLVVSDGLKARREWEVSLFLSL